MSKLLLNKTSYCLMIFFFAFRALTDSICTMITHTVAIRMTARAYTILAQCADNGMIQKIQNTTLGVNVYYMYEYRVFILAYDKNL